MKKYRHIVVPLVVLAVLLGMAGCSKRAATPKQAETGKNATAVPAAPATPAAPVTGQPAGGASDPRADSPVILAFGDSLTEGYQVPRDQNYPSRLQAELDRLGYRYRVVNAGISGDTTAQGRARISIALRQHKPEIVILALGGNDGLRGLPTAQMKQNLATIIEQSQKAGARVLLAGIEAPPNYGPDYTGAFRQVFTDLAAEYKVPLLPLLIEGVGGMTELNLPDGIHPTGEGYKIVTGNVLAALQPLLKK